MAERVPETRVPAVPWENWFRQVEQGFSSFFTKFLAYLMMFQSGACQRMIQGDPIIQFQVCTCPSLAATATKQLPGATTLTTWGPKQHQQVAMGGLESDKKNDVNVLVTILFIIFKKFVKLLYYVI